MTITQLLLALVGLIAFTFVLCLLEFSQLRWSLAGPATLLTVLVMLMFLIILLVLQAAKSLRPLLRTAVMEVLNLLSELMGLTAFVLLLMSVS